MPGENLTRAEARERASVVADRVVRGHARPHHRADDVRVAHRGPVRRHARGEHVHRPDRADRARGHAQRRGAGRRRRWSPTRGSRSTTSPRATSSSSSPTAAYMNTGEGLHRFVDPVDDEVYLYSQFEVADSRRVFAVFEQPDLKATFAFTVTAPAHWTVVSNYPQVGAPEPRGRQQPQRRRRQGHRDLDLRADAAHRVLRHRDHRRAVPRRAPAAHQLGRSHHPARRLLPRLAGRAPGHRQHPRPSRAPGSSSTSAPSVCPYPFAKYDQLFVPEFNAGAMENAGAVTFLESLRVPLQGPRGRRSSAARVTILHELAHMWFGDLVTMRWWDDLWLNESFAEYVSTLATAEATRWTSAWTTFSSLEKNWAYRQDQLPSTHPIVADMRDLEDVEVNFDGITYAKGASVLKQLVAWVGQDEFFAGVRAYFAQARVGQHRAARPAHRARGHQRPRPVRLVRRSGWRRPASRCCDRRSRSTTPASSRRSRSCRRCPTSTRCSGRTASASAATTSTPTTGRLVRTRPRRARRRRPAHRGARAASACRGPRWSWSTTTTSPTPRSGSTRSRSPRRSSTSARSTTRCRARSCWTAAWDATRDGETPAARLRRPGAAQHRARDRLLRRARPAAPAGAPRSTCTWRREHRAASDVGGGRRGCSRSPARAEAGSDTQLQLVKAFAGRAATHRAAGRRRGPAGRAARPSTGLSIDTDLRWELLTSLVAGGRAGEPDIAAAARRRRDGDRPARRRRRTRRRPDAEAKATAWAVRGRRRRSAERDPGRDDRRLRPRARPRAAAAVRRAVLRGASSRSGRRKTSEMAQNIVVGLYPTDLAGDAPVDVLGATDAWLDGAPGRIPRPCAAWSSSPATASDARWPRRRPTARRG